MKYVRFRLHLGNPAGMAFLKKVVARKLCVTGFHRFCPCSIALRKTTDPHFGDEGILACFPVRRLIEHFPEEKWSRLVYGFVLSGSGLSPVPGYAAIRLLNFLRTSHCYVTVNRQKNPLVATSAALSVLTPV